MKTNAQDENHRMSDLKGALGITYTNLCQQGNWGSETANDFFKVKKAPRIFY